MIKKPKNLLINSDCNIKICDFGLARALLEDRNKNIPLTEYMATRWYRPPEVLLKWDSYDKTFDIWSIGCIFAELLDRKVLFPGNNSDEQLELILTILGTPNKEELSKHPNRLLSIDKIFKHGSMSKIPWKEVISNYTDEAIDLLEKFLKFEPEKRITLEAAMKHSYFDGMPEVLDDKPEPVMRFDFDFDDQELSMQDYKNLILHESLLYHDERLLNEYDKAKDIYRKEQKNKKRNKEYDSKMEKSKSNKSGMSRKSSSISKKSSNI